MSPGPVFLPLTTRGHHLPSSWTHFPKLHSPVTHHTPSCSPSSWTIYTPHSHYSACLNCLCMCFSTGFSCWGHMHCVPFSVSQSSTCFFCLPCWSFCFFIIKEFFLHLDPHPVLPLSLISPFRDRIPTARMGPTEKLLNVHQGDRGIEDYVRDFLVVARQ